MESAATRSGPPDAAPPRLAAGHARRAVLTATLMALSLVAVWTVAVLLVNQTTRSASEKATAQADVAARVAEQLLLRTIDGVDASLALIRARRLLDLSGEGEGAAIVAALLADAVAEGRHGLLGATDIDPDGATRWVLPVRRAAAAAAAAVQNPPPQGPGLFVDAQQRDPVSGRWSLRMGRPIEDEAGAVIGTAEARIDPVALSAELARMAPGSLDLFYVLRKDGIILARSDALDPMLGRDPTAGRQIIATAEASGGRPFRSMSPLDGREHFVAVRMVPGTPLLVAAAIDAGNALAPVRDVLLLAVIVALLTSALVVLLALFVRRRRERRHTRAALQQARLAEAAAAGARAEIEALLAGLPIAVYRARLRPDEDLDISYASAAMAELPEAGAGVSRHAFLASLLAGRDATVEYAIPREGRPVVWLREGARVVANGPGGIEVVGYRADITAERQFAAQAAEASKLATLGEMATGLAHELNQPVTAMALGADNAADALEAEGASGIAEAVGTLRRVAGEATRAQTIIDHLRVFGRKDPGPLGPVDLERAVDGALVLAGNALRGAGIEVARDIPPGLPEVQGQLVLIEQVLLNLFLNARDAIAARPDGARRLTVAARPGPPGQVELSVRDSGGGIAPEIMDRIFDPFFTTKPVGQGTGLGLALSHGMMAAIGGSIRFANTEDGAEFVLGLAAMAPTSAEAEESRHIA